MTAAAAVVVVVIQQTQPLTGMRPRFFNQKIAQNEPEKKIPSTAANATNLSANDASLPIHLIAQSAFFLMQGTWV